MPLLSSRGVKTTVRPGRTISALIAILLVAGAVHFSWIQLDLDPPYPDELRSVDDIDRAMSILKDHSWAGVPRLLTLGNRHPPGVPLCGLPVYAASAGDFKLTQSIEVVYLLLAIIGVYLFGRRAISATAGLFMAALVAAAPIASSYTHEFLLEGPLGAMLPFALLALLDSQGLTRRGPCFLFGLVAGWMLLIKWTAAVFLVGPGVLALVEGLRMKSGRGLSLGLGITLLGVAIAVPWYVTHVPQILDILHEDEVLYKIRPHWQPFASRTEPASLLFYLFALDDILGLALALSALGGMALFFIRPRYRTRPAAYALAAFLPAYLFFSLLLTKGARHLSPAAPALVILGSYWLFRAAGVHGLRKVAMVCLLLFTAWAGLLPALGVGPVQPVQLEAGELLGVTIVARQAPPNRKPWPFGEITAAIHQDSRDRAISTPRVIVLPNLKPINGYTVFCLAKKRGLTLRILGVKDGTFQPEALNRSDYILTMTLPDGQWRGRLQPVRVQIARWLLGEFPPGPPPQLAEILAVPLPNGFDAILYRRTGVLDATALQSLRASVWKGRSGVPGAATPDPQADPGDDGAAKRVALGPRMLRIWIEPSTKARRGTLCVLGAEEAGLRFEVHGTPGSRYRLARSRVRRRWELGFDVTELANPEVVKAGQLDPKGAAWIPLKGSLTLEQSGHVQYFQFFFESPSGLGLSNWVALDLQ